MRATLFQKRIARLAPDFMRATIYAFKVLYITTRYQKIQIWRKFMCIEHEHGLIPHSGPFLAPIEPILGPTNSFTAL